MAKAFKGNDRVTILKTGIGPVNADKALRAWKGSADLLVSTGLCGALQPDMRTGDIVADLRGAESAWAHAARETAERLRLGFHFGKILHSDTVLTSPAEKRALGEKERASAVDMESAAVRGFASSVARDAIVLRVVLDTVDDALPKTMPAGEDFLALAGYAVKNARQLPLLAALGVKQRSAMNNLSTFLKSYLELL